MWEKHMEKLTKHAGAMRIEWSYSMEYSMECWLTPSGVIKHANFHIFWRFDGKIIEPNGRLSTSKKLSTGRYPIRFDRTC